MGGRPYSPTRTGPRGMALAGEREPFRDRLPAPLLFPRYLDLGDPSCHRQTARRLGSGLQSRRGPFLSRVGCEQRSDLRANVKVSYDVTKKVAVGIEYYGALGSITGFDPLSDQQQAIFPAIDLNLSPNWEFNFGAGIGMTGGTDHLLVKMILGRRLKFGKK
jgi:hypothetical protein